MAKKAKLAFGLGVVVCGVVFREYHWFVSAEKAGARSCPECEEVSASRHGTSGAYGIFQSSVHLLFLSYAREVAMPQRAMRAKGLRRKTVGRLSLCAKNAARQRILAAIRPCRRR